MHSFDGRNTITIIISVQFTLRCKKRSRMKKTHTRTQNEAVLLRKVAIVRGPPLHRSSNERGKNARHYLPNIYLDETVPFRRWEKYECNEGNGCEWDENIKNPRKIIIFFRVFSSCLQIWNFQSKNGNPSLYIQVDSCTCIGIRHTKMCAYAENEFKKKIKTEQ